MKKFIVCLSLSAILASTASYAADVEKAITPVKTEMAAASPPPSAPAASGSPATPTPVSTAPANPTTQNPIAANPLSDPFASMVNTFFNNDGFSNGNNSVNGMMMSTDKRFLPIKMMSNGYPKMDMYETKDNLIIQFEIPGIDKTQLNLEITDNYVSLKYEEKAATDNKDKKYAISERSYGSFSRLVSLPSYVDSKKAEAKYENGVLNITIPKSEAAKAQPKKIEIK